MQKAFKKLRHLFATTLLYWLALMLFGTALMTFRFTTLLRNRLALTGLLAFILSALFFRRHRFAVVYIFGHELTHWATAKLFLKKTGRIRIQRLSGATEIYGTNVVITLAPYIIPFYLMVVIGIYGLSQLFVYPSPLWARYLVAVLIGMGYAYHIMLNAFAIKQAQSDLQIYGPIYSFGFILAGNALFLLVALLVTTAQWREAYHAFGELIALQADIVQRVLQAIVSAFRDRM